ncbi:MAG: hypothetical protein ACD_78C00034G0004 [uncultured bacterium (gcode 4)]|uniref:Uncharacterized protein n=1 Tax=uncultured bacterium (gcode 4) TaxID=1234023 RepID=K1XZV8_9BACT|nr:MAG: hypothetical protein ACD_78C00034G0004 [uncultured bacterium (gcode 4)]
MSKIVPIDSLNITPSEWVVLSPAITRIVEKTHQWALSELERFQSSQTNPFLYYLWWVNASIASILGKQADPADFSRIISLKKRFREQETADDYHAQETWKKAEIIPINWKITKNIPFEKAA